MRLLLCFACCGLLQSSLSAAPTLKGPLPGVLLFEGEDGFATFTGNGHLTLMGRVDVHGEFQFLFDEDSGGILGVGIMAIEAANGDVLVSNVSWEIDAEGNGSLEFRWPGKIVFADGTTVESTGRFVELPFGGLRGTSTFVVNPDRDYVIVKMTGEIVDPDPIDF